MLGLIKKNRALYGALRRSYARLRSANRAKVFGRIYETNGWDDSASVSGPGSSLAATEHVRAALPKLVRDLGISSLLDAPCGDFHWMQHVELEAEYIGGDLVAALIERNKAAFPGHDFRTVDLLKGPLPSCDAVFCRDCMVHMSYRDIDLALKAIKRSGARYLMATTFPAHIANEDTVPPYWRALNLEAAPFDLGAPVELVRDYSDAQKNDQGKHLGVWLINP